MTRHLYKNKTGTSEVGAISKAQKAQFLKLQKGFLKVQFVAKYQKKIEGGPFGDKKIQKNTMPKKFKGGTLQSRPVLYVLVR